MCLVCAVQEKKQDADMPEEVTLPAVLSQQSSRAFESPRIKLIELMTSYRTRGAHALCRLRSRLVGPYSHSCSA